MSETVLPPLAWRPTPASSSRSNPVSLVVVHRWGVRVSDPAGEAVTMQGVSNYFDNPGNRASAHIIYGGSAEPAAIQKVAWADMAWAEAAYNGVADDIESADDLWVPDSAEKMDVAGMQQLARIVAFRLHVRGLPAEWSHTRGFCRHADLGSAGGGHLECPTTDLRLWRSFVLLVKAELERGGFRSVWGR